RVIRRYRRSQGKRRALAVLLVAHSSALAAWRRTTATRPGRGNEYAQILLGDIVFGENATAEPRVLAQVDNPEQLEKLVSLLGNHEPTALLNYVAFSLAVFLSPALPNGGIAQELLTLSHGEHVPQVPEELQSCVHLLARTYRYGTLSLARHAVSRDTSEGNSYKYEGDMRALVDGAREQVSALLRNHTEGMTSAELWTALPEARHIASSLPRRA
ncbi:hypothetical protein MTO96_013092, partial [Rhipicephalus appendiculatus]